MKVALTLPLMLIFSATSIAGTHEDFEDSLSISGRVMLNNDAYKDRYKLRLNGIQRDGMPDDVRVGKHEAINEIKKNNNSFRRSLRNEKYNFSKSKMRSDEYKDY